LLVKDSALQRRIYNLSAETFLLKNNCLVNSLIVIAYVNIEAVIGQFENLIKKPKYQPDTDSAGIFSTIGAKMPEKKKKH